MFVLVVHLPDSPPARASDELGLSTDNSFLLKEIASHPLLSRLLFFCLSSLSFLCSVFFFLLSLGEVV